MNRLDRVMGSLLETCGQRYEFVHDRKNSKITFQVPGFKLTAMEQKEGDGIELLLKRRARSIRWHVPLITLQE